MEQQESSIRFVRHNFDNLQSLIRFADAKAGALTAFMFALGGTGFGLFQKAMAKLDFGPGPWYSNALDILFLIAWFVFSATAIGVVLKLLFGLVLPKAAKHYTNVDQNRDLMYWDHVLWHQSNKSYFDSVQGIDEPLELRNLSDQVYELASITRTKMKMLDELRNWLWCATISWVVGTLTTVIMLKRG